MKKLYETAMINHGGREGEIKAPNGSMAMKITSPGIHKDGTNPEQLFAAGYSSCFNGAIGMMAEQDGITGIDSTVTARVSLFSLDEGGFKIGVTMEVHFEGGTTAQHEQLVKEADAFCPYSKAVRGNIDVDIQIV